MASLWQRTVRFQLVYYTISRVERKGVFALNMGTAARAAVPGMPWITS